MDYHVELQQLEAQHAAVVAGHVGHTGIGDFLGRAFSETIGAIQAQGLAPAGPPFGRYVLVADGFDIEAGFPTAAPIAPTGDVHHVELPAGEAAVVMHVGPYEQVAGAYAACGDWMSANGFEPAAGPWESYLDGPEVAMPRTVVTFPCRRVG